MHSKLVVFLTLAVGANLAGCAGPAGRFEQTPTLSATPAEGAIEGRPALSMPIQIPGHATCLIPFALESQKGWFEDRDPFTRGGYADSGYSRSPASVNAALYSAGVSGRWHNAIVRDMKTGEEWPVLDRRGVISRYEMFVRPGRNDDPPVSLGLVFIATIDDTTKDGALDDRDATVAVVADADGRRPRIVTPARAQVWSVAYDPRLKLVYLYVVEDTDGDGRYTPMDAPRPFVYDPRGDGPATPLVAGESARRLESFLK